MALRELDGTQWRLFEKLASVFLSTEYAELRPVADASGDGGFDAMLFEVSDDPSIAVQYSVRTDWKDKINATCRRLKETSPTTKILIFVTNQMIGGESATIKKSVRQNHGIYLDPRDREWLITQRNSSTANEAEAEALARNVVDPLLGNSSLISRQAQALDDIEAKAAFVHLGLQWADDSREKGLTKVCFEAIVRSVLRNTTSESRLSRSEIREQIAALLPAHPHELLNAQVDGALARLDKQYIRHWRKPDEFCLTWAERERLSNRVSELSLLDSALRAELSAALQISLQELGITLAEDQLDRTVSAARSVLERVFLERGEAFAAAVARDRDYDVRFTDIEAVIDKVAVSSKKALAIPSHVLAATIQGLLLDPPEGVRSYLRGLADTYTLFAFLRETPDVQSAVVKMFSDADIWLDTSVVLPLLAEDLLDEGARNHSSLIKAASEAGLGLFLTDGVIEEVATHIARCRSYYRVISSGQTAYGDPPFLYAVYKISGRRPDDFVNWLSNFVGASPMDDLFDYFDDEFGIKEKSLKEHVESATVGLRAAVAEVWHEKRDRKDRRLAALGLDPMDVTTRTKLIDHDVENYVGVAMRREHRRERRSTYGYRTWWLTLDGTAFRVHKELLEVLPEREVPTSPAISPDFMVNYLSLGPIRRRLSKKSESMLPLMVNMHAMDVVPPALIELADQLRDDLSDLPPRVVRRKIRETLEDARRLLGPTATAGEVGLTEEIKAKLRQQARTR